MKDQVAALTRKGVSACYIGREETEDMIEEVHEGQYQLVFSSPESILTNETWREMLQCQTYKDNLVGFVVDEAHCVKSWGVTFRHEFSNLGELQSLIPPYVHIMALTATATCASRRSICRILGMKSPLIVAQSPNKPNIKYMVIPKPKTATQEDVEEAFASLVEEVRKKKAGLDRVIVFTQTYDDCTSLFLFFKSTLGAELSQPPGLQQFAKYRIVDMFTACTHPDVKKTILERYTYQDSSLRIVIATVAFGMGLDCPNVRKIIHWGVPSDVETYLQETGRAGRDGLPATATLYYGGRDMMGTRVGEPMREYCKLVCGCRRKFLLKEFDKDSDTDVASVTGCLCCDLCANACTCIRCNDKLQK